MFAEQPRRMSEAEYLAWEEGQEERHELIDGHPVARSLRMMSGGTSAHALLCASMASALRRRTRGGPCRGYGGELKIRSPTGAVRYPDAMVDCGPLNLRSYFASEPAIVVEVLSPSNTAREQARLLWDYQAVPSIQQIIFLEQDAPAGFAWTRDEQAWRLSEFDGWEAAITLGPLGVELLLSEVYEDILPRPQPAQA